MPELKLSISFPNLTSDGFPVLYPNGWSSSDVSHVCLTIISLVLPLHFVFELFPLHATNFKESEGT